MSGGRHPVKVRLSKEELERLEQLQEEEEPAAGVLLRGLEALWKKAKREGMR